MLTNYEITTVDIAEGTDGYSFPSLKKTSTIQARLDSTALTRHNARYWSSTENGLTRIVLDQATNETARDRCRYEYLNNVVMFGAGLMKTALNIGRGARLQLATKQTEWNKHLETEFRYWCEDVRWNKNFRMAPKSLLYDGEFILRFRKNPRVKPTQLDIEVMDSRLLKTPYQFAGDPNVYDGIRFDKYRNPICYYFQKTQINPPYTTTEFEAVPAGQVVHFFDWSLPGQMRGTPEAQAGIPQLAMGRNLTKNVLTIAEIAARSGMVLYTDNPAEETADIDTMSYFDLEPGVIQAMPAGWKLGYPPSQQFAVDLNAANKGINNQFGMSTGLASNMVNNDSSDYNLSAARLDRLTTGVLSEIRQDDLALEVLSAVYNVWHRVQANHDDIAWKAMKEYKETRRIPRKWRFPEWPSVDPMKDANVKKLLVQLGVMLRSDIILDSGNDPEEFIEQYKREKEIFGDVIDVKEENARLSDEGMSGVENE